MTRSCSTLDIHRLDQTVEAVAADPAVGVGSFRTVTQWENGSVAQTTARSFTLKTDEPTPLGGKDSAIDPMELVLAAIGTCLTIGWVTQAVRRGLEYRNLRIEVSGDYDLRGFLDLDTQVRPGFHSISYEVFVDADADPAVLEEIRQVTERTSPMFDNVLNATPVQGVIRRQG
ncbi:MAG: OsmC family protein [Xenophilus sp.]